MTKDLGVEDDVRVPSSSVLEAFFSHCREYSPPGPSIDDIVNHVEETLARFEEYKQRYGEGGVSVYKNSDGLVDTENYISPNVSEHLLQSFHQKDDKGRGLVSTVVDYPLHVSRKLAEFETQTRELYGCDGRKLVVFDFDHSYFVRSGKMYEIFFPTLIGVQKFWGRIHRLTEPGCDWVVNVKDFRPEL
ncbi:hypothetical protein HZB03_04295 [Candidatus Woesearchaeota archaeon]|nr:hypothetical protein [Candidatus Woesearchaeota archaeon]